MQLPANQQSKALRLQFSLRMLLLVMLLLAVALAIFRWSWAETNEDKGITRTTNFRRGWNGTPLKHGLETEVSRVTGKMDREALFEDGVLRRERRFAANGELISEIVFFPERGETIEKKFLNLRGSC
jgi:hypothetical protein